MAAGGNRRAGTRNNRQQQSSKKSFMITNVSPKKRLHSFQLSNDRKRGTAEAESHGAAIKLRELEGRERRSAVGEEEVEEEETAADYVDRVKDGYIGELTYKNILKLDDRETNETII